jgi:hypothetical protein
MGLSLFPGRRILDHGVLRQLNYETYKYFIESGLKIGTYK